MREKFFRVRWLSSFVLPLSYLSCAANRAFYFMHGAESTNFRCIRALLREATD